MFFAFFQLGLRPFFPVVQQRQRCERCHQSDNEIARTCFYQTTAEPDLRTRQREPSQCCYCNVPYECCKKTIHSESWCTGVDSNHRTPKGGQIYSLLALTAHPPVHDDCAFTQRACREPTFKEPLRAFATKRGRMNGCARTYFRTLWHYCDPEKLYGVRSREELRAVSGIKFLLRPPAKPGIHLGAGEGI